MCDNESVIIKMRNEIYTSGKRKNHNKTEKGKNGLGEGLTKLKAKMADDEQ